MPEIMCPKCEFDTMATIQPCKLRCENCGMVMDCEDKGFVW